MALKREYFVCWIDNLNHDVDPFIKGFSQNLTDYWFLELDWQLKHTPKSEYYTKLFSSHNEAINFLEKSLYEHALIINVGTDLEGNGPQFLRTFDQYVSDDDILIGHILDKEDRYYELHEQIYYLNVKKWKTIGCPKLGEIGSRILYTKPIRSKENHHDNYTPYWIKQGQEKKFYSNTKHGHNLIAKILEAGLTIKSFPEHVRNQKEYFYPNENDCNDSIYKFIHKNISYKFYPFNTENIPKGNIVKNISCMATVASGLNHLKVIKEIGYANDFKLMLFDYDEYALYIMKELYENWDGVNYTDFIKKIDVLEKCRKDLDNNEFNKFVNFFGGENEWISWFENFKRNIKEIKYLNLDILNFYHEVGFYNLLDFLQTSQGNKLLWLSNIFCYRPTSLFKSLYKRGVVQDKLMDKLKHIDDLQLCYGPAINGWNNGSWLMSPKKYVPCADYCKGLIPWKN